ncbi:hypothetical protein CFK39_07330 [Brachybacterium avium]|uniref:DUF559 domain-containing protein n=1 Tax=Brachybacterium avium TaxID=2017485 RepID=A0A220UCM8_9MICO|nr:hypothetical protein [Brachybacterium avium]ASK65676.1 hypothetical protein CFK39_07330 [Brachybacterium avium]
MARDLTRFHGALLHRSEWISLGLHPRDLASGRFITAFPGYLTLTDHPASFNGLAWALQNSVRPGSVLSHTTAALLWGIPLPWRLEDGVGMLRQPEPEGGAEDPLIPSVRPGSALGSGASLPLLHCRVLPGASSSVGRGVIVHRHPEAATARRGRLLVSSQAETLRELATLLPLWDVVAAVEAVISPDAVHPGETLESLRAEVEARRGAAGTARIRRALELAREGVRSPGESVMRLMLMDAGFPEPEPNLPVEDPRTGKIRYVDLAWASIRFGLEYDGDGHRTTKEQWREDETRRDELAAQGWTLARSHGGDLRQPLRMLLRLQRSAGERGLRVPTERRVRRAARRLAADQPSLRLDGQPS